MLITDDSNGKSDGKERDQLQAMVAVGSEFVTYQDDTSRVQKSGEFVRIEKDSGESAARFLLLHETSQTYTQDGQDLTGNELRSLATNVKLRKRSRLYVSEIDPTNGNLPFRELGGFKTQTRISRHHGHPVTTRPREYEAVKEANYTAQAGKRRLFSKGDGKVWLVLEVNIPGDTRYFNDALRATDTTITPHEKARGLRAARVELVEINTTTGEPGKPFFSFDVHSGLGFDATAKFFDSSIRSSAEMYDTNNVYAAFSGVLYGSSLNLPSVMNVPNGGDASDTYAVAEPAVSKSGAKEYTPIIAVYPSDDDVYDSQSAGPYRLTCKRTTPEGDVAISKIEFQALPTLPKHYLAVRGLSLHRTSPTTVVLRVNVHAMQFGAGGSVYPSTSDVLFFWTQDNGANWTYAPVSAGFPGVVPYGGLLVRDKDTLLAFSWWPLGSAADTMSVHSITVTGTQNIASVPASLFNAGLMAPIAPGSSTYAVPYTPVGFGGAVAKKSASGKKTKRLWMQFDPYWTYKQGDAHVLDYPGSRPMLLVSDDGGLTWARRLLPVPWSFRVGFVVPTGETTLAVPVYTPRKDHDKPIGITIYLSKDGGDTWGSASSGPTLPGDTWVDGNIVMAAQYLDGHGDIAREQDISDSSLEYNRGELLPMLVLSDVDGKPLATNPSRPWMTDHKFKEPTYG